MSYSQTILEPAGIGSVGNYELNTIPKSAIIHNPSPIQRSISEREIRDQQSILETSNSAVVQDGQAPSNAVKALQRWNQPRINMWRVFACFWAFFVLGMNAASVGALVPYLEKYYNLSYTVVSLIFLFPFAGYSTAAFANNHVHIRFGQRGIAVIGASLHLISYIILSIHPPYPVLVVMFTLIGFANGLIDAAWCAWIGNMANANEVSGVLQACYALGATSAPLIATSMIVKAGLPWYAFYYVMLSAAAIELVGSSLAFWKQTGAVFQEENPSNSNSKTGRTREAIRQKQTWVFAAFIFGYVGAEFSLGGWIVKFMTTSRNASAFNAGISATGFWSGMCAGRLVLPFVTTRKHLGEHRAVLLYLVISVALTLVFYLVPSFPVSAVAAALLGFFFGPMYPTAIVLVAKLLPLHLHIGVIGFGAAIGGSGSALLPFLVGVIAEKKGVKMLLPVVLALLVAITGCWVLLPKVGKKEWQMEGDNEEAVVAAEN